MSKKNLTGCNSPSKRHQSEDGEMQDGSKKEGSDQNLQKGASEGVQGGALQENMPSQWGREF